VARELRRIETGLESVEVRGAGSGRLRMQLIKDASAPTLTGFVTTNVSAGSIVHTDDRLTWSRPAEESSGCHADRTRGSDGAKASPLAITRYIPNVSLELRDKSFLDRVAADGGRDVSGGVTYERLDHAGAPKDDRVSPSAPN